ncbi:MAG TPA: SipW-dependent-type signal peptide-containing protein, partial [Candidatus Blautia intestinipullorum]|nr:SipW-dependent-type signal peptide-containing protein [Candidatus Blautia intestinipullorum]
MGRRIKTAAAVLAAALLGITGTYGYFSDTLKVTNHISLGDVNIGLQEFEKKGGIETAY